MKLIRFGEAGKEKPGIQLDAGKRIDISAFGEDYTEAFFETDGLDRLKAWLEKEQENCPEVSQETRLGAPLVRPSKIVCIGLNYICLLYTSPSPRDS